ncbi:uncharacterized protein CDAR_574211 [Caerostris darwini]|uniref:Uncharacterized protein n=1 Tax=Caerostris darwini TaxID=1538125 RepID=A0AAV4R8T4_9ARAC|nr:uncharacterized protein CDAR_574211 [Caerostris darwini]
MLQNDYKETSDYVAVEILSDEEKRSHFFETDEVLARQYIKRPEYLQSLSKANIELFLDASQNDSFKFHNFNDEFAKVPCVENFTQTDSFENSVAVQANIIPKVFCNQSQQNQSVQTEYDEEYDTTHFYHNHDCDSTISYSSDSSILSESSIPPHTNVIELSCIPTTLKQQDNYVENLEEKTYRVSRWLDDWHQKLLNQIS